MAASDFVLKHLRAKGVAPKDLQKALNISASQASRMLDGSRGISVWHLDAIADLLGTTVPDLFRDLPDHSFGVEHASTDSPTTSGGGAAHVADAQGHRTAEELVTVAEGLRSTADTIADEIQKIADRLTRRVAHAPLPHTGGHPGAHESTPVRRRRKAG